MKEKVIFDTNIIRNEETNNFLGGRKELEKFLQIADIVIPETVLQEIKRQKRKKLKGNKDKFLRNPLHNLFGLNEVDTKAFDIDGYIQKLKDEESILFETIELKDNNVLPKIKELAFKKQAPFERGDNTDKGFKDALIYFTVLEYLQEIPNKKVFVCVKDGRLTEAFNKHHNIIVVKDYDGFKEKSVSQFFDDYFIEKVNTELDITITKDNIIDYWENIDDNKNVLVQSNEVEYIIEVDSGEIVSVTERNDYQKNIKEFIILDSPEIIRELATQLTPVIKYFSDDEIIDILNASFSNEKIRWSIGDSELKEFIGPLYKFRGSLIEGDVNVFLKETFA